MLRSSELPISREFSKLQFRKRLELFVGSSQYMPTLKCVTEGGCWRGLHNAEALICSRRARGRRGSAYPISRIVRVTYWERILGGILWALVVILFAYWLAGFALHFGGALIHLLLFVALVLIIVNVLTGRGARVFRNNRAER